MALYEHIFIARQDLLPAQVETLTEKFIGILRDNGGSIGKTEQLGLRNFAYPIKKASKGHYVLLNINSDSSALEEFERVLSISEDILRFQTIKVDEHEKGPSALLKASRYQREGYEDETPSNSSRSNPSSNISETEIKNDQTTKGDE